MHSTAGQMTICTERSVDKEPMAPEVGVQIRHVVKENHVREQSL